MSISELFRVSWGTTESFSEGASALPPEEQILARIPCADRDAFWMNVEPVFLCPRIVKMLWATSSMLSVPAFGEVV